MINEVDTDNDSIEEDNHNDFDYKKEKRILSKVGFSYFFLLLIMFFVPSFLLSVTFNPDNNITLAYNFIGFFVAAIVLYYSTKDISVSKPFKDHKYNLKPYEYIMYLILGYGLMMLGYGFSSYIRSLFVPGSVNPMQTFQSSNILMTFLYAILIGPIFEEYFFRKVIIDRLVRYGELFAVLSSAFMFMIYHMNFYQFIGVFLMGLVLGHVYVKTNRIEYTITLHQISNFLGLFVPLLLNSSSYAWIYNYICIVIIILSVLILIYLLYTVEYNQGEVKIPDNKGLKFFFKCPSIGAFTIFGLFIGVLNLGIFA